MADQGLSRRKRLDREYMLQHHRRNDLGEQGHPDQGMAAHPQPYDGSLLNREGKPFMRDAPMDWDIGHSPDEHNPVFRNKGKIPQLQAFRRLLDEGSA